MSERESRTPYRRVVLKLSGESFAASGERGISMNEVATIAQEVVEASKTCQIAIVIGGGNILRGAQFKGENASIQEATAHYMGMLATAINGLALQDALETCGADTRLMTAIPMDNIAARLTKCFTRSKTCRKNIAIRFGSDSFRKCLHCCPDLAIPQRGCN